MMSASSKSLRKPAHQLDCTVPHPAKLERRRRIQEFLGDLIGAVCLFVITYGALVAGAVLS